MIFLKGWSGVQIALTETRNFKPAVNLAHHISPPPLSYLLKIAKGLPNPLDTLREPSVFLRYFGKKHMSIVQAQNRTICHGVEGDVGSGP